MVRTCIEGHEITEDNEVCEKGHPLLEEPGATAAVVPIQLTPQQLNDMIQSAIAGAISAHNTAFNRPSDGAPNVKKPDRPGIDLGSNEGQWAFFLDEWQEYKRRCRLGGSDIISELKAACTIDLRREVFDFVGSAGLAIISESDLLDQIKKLAVKGKNKSVHRKEFYAMNQAPGQPVQAFVAKLKSKAVHCDYTFKCINGACGHQVNSYAEHMIADQMVVGCADTDIQQEVLAKDSQLHDFQARLDLIQALEEGKRAKSELFGESTSTLASSQYQRQKVQGKIKTDGPPYNTTSKSRCTGCGSSEHGPGTGTPRAGNCPAWNKYCDFCNIRGHLSRVCRGKIAGSSKAHEAGPVQKSVHSTVQSLKSGEDTSNFFAFDNDQYPKPNKQDLAFSKKLQHNNSMAWQERHKPFERTNFDKKIIIPHMEWLDGRFQACKPKSLPKLTIEVSILHEAHRDFKKAIPTHVLKEMKHNVPLMCFTDTGAQTCACGPEILDHLGIDSKHLIPTSHRIVGVTQSLMEILGVLLLRIEAGGKATHQVVYVSKNINGFFLSEQSQIDLGIIPASYPSPNTASQEASMAAKSEEQCLGGDNVAPCGCPLRTAPPPAPTTIPFLPIAENRDKIEKWLLEYYSGSAFNTCEHQNLPKMKVKPLDIHFRPEAKPKAFHCPIPVPHHWKKQVKADLDRDVRLGIIEPVPPGTPTVWCSKMVVVTKKDGSPRRTVDLQHLNDATYRETHHAPSPFNQASVVPPNTQKQSLMLGMGIIHCHCLHLQEMLPRS